MLTRTPFVHFAATVLFCLAAVEQAAAGDWFVDNRFGNDTFDGLTRAVGGGRSGPVQTIRRAVERARTGDTITLANHGTPYYESLTLVGRRHSGFGGSPFTIIGNGAVISGARRMPVAAWKHLGAELWQFTPRRKGYYQLLHSDVPLPEQPVPRDAKSLPQLKPGAWCAWRGSIYHQAELDSGRSPLDLPLAFAYDDVGLTLLNVEHVVIQDLTFRHFHQDGINAHDRCQSVVLERVRLLENGRAGLSVGGSSLVGLKDSEVAGNREVQVLNSELAQTEILDSKLGDSPGNPFRIEGGHLLIDGAEVSEPKK